MRLIDADAEIVKIEDEIKRIEERIERWRQRKQKGDTVGKPTFMKKSNHYREILPSVE